VTEIILALLWSLGAVCEYCKYVVASVEGSFGCKRKNLQNYFVQLDIGRQKVSLCNYSLEKSVLIIVTVMCVDSCHVLFPKIRFC